MVNVLSHGNYPIMNFLHYLNWQTWTFWFFILLNLFKINLFFNYYYLFFFWISFYSRINKQSCEINMVKCCDKGRNYIHSFFLWVNEQNNTIKVAAFQEWGAGNDPEALELAFQKGLHTLMHISKLLQTWLIETQVWVMICLGCLRFPSVSSSKKLWIYCNDILSRGSWWYKKELIEFWGWSGPS